jgi:aspartate racemase
MEMKRLGIIGGIGPESTIDYYRSILTVYAERNGDASAPHLIINSIDFDKVVRLVTANELDELAGYFVTEVRRLAASGVDLALIAANTPHIVFDQIQQESPIPLISIVRATCDAAKALGLKRLTLLGTRFTMQGHFYSDVFSRESMQLVVPEKEDQTYIHAKYMNELVKGILLPETHAGLLEIIDRLRVEQDMDAVILAGTELPLILREPSHDGIPFLDTTQIHVRAAIIEMSS